MAVIGAVEIVGDGPGRLRLAPIAAYSAERIRAFVAANIACGATLKTDEWASYPGTSEDTTPMSSAPWPPTSSLTYKRLISPETAG